MARSAEPGKGGRALEARVAVGDPLDGQLAQLHLVARQRPRLVAEHVLDLRAAATGMVNWGCLIDAATALSR